jgi:nucleoside phosphorylase
VILVVAAWAPELRGLGRRLRDGRGRPVERAVVGIGPVEAAEGTARALAAREPSLVVLVGTAGIYPRATQRPAIGQVVVARAIHFVSLSAVRGLAYFPGPMPRVAATSARFRRLLARASGAPLGDVACPAAITRSASAATALARSTGAALENLEAFAVARAAAAARRPFVAILGVANQVGPRAHAQWAAHAVAAAAAACAGVEAFVASTAPIPRGHR